ncbi:UNVERIFIED_CONTAM: hypothetical protein GTU68_039111 [Idotea baltica]|nr:hypothetical protein [Idotea baltica]
MSGPIETHRVVFHGRVQGVGFRWTTKRVAKRFPVTGYVRNQPDGTVELMVQGAASAIAGVISAVIEAMAANITDHADDRVESDERFDRFRIQR